MIQYPLPGSRSYQEQLYPDPARLDPNTRKALRLDTYQDVIAHFTASSLAEDGIQIEPGSLGVAKGAGDTGYMVSFRVLPAFALSLRYLTLITRITRAAMLEVMNADFILASRSRGASEWTVVVVHALRNAAAPVLTVIGYNVGFVLAGSALIEAVFAWPGIGRLMFDALLQRDYSLLLGAFLVTAAMAVLFNLITDFVYTLVDPRIELA